MKKIRAIVSLTLVFEIIQFIFAIVRADITDVLSNTFGGIIGIGIYALLSKVLKGTTNKVVNLLACGIDHFGIITCRSIGKSPMGDYQIGNSETITKERG